LIVVVIDRRRSFESPGLSEFQTSIVFSQQFKKMNVHRDLDRLPAFNRAVITIGTFDGVHTGHQKIIQQLIREAKEIDGETVIITFHPHPRKIVGSQRVKLINTLDEKIALLAEKGIDHLVVIPFTEAFSQQSAAEYVKDFLVRKFQPHTIIIGYDHRFGKDRTGDYQLLERLSPTENYVLREIPVHVLNEILVSSTRIRQAIESGEMDTANQLLGYEFFFEGRVVTGNKMGRTIGYPTANLEVRDPEKLLPANGVYAVKANISENDYPDQKFFIASGSSPALSGMMNIGFRPTIGGTSRTIEVNLFNFNKDIYGKDLVIFVSRYLRGEQKFSGLEALREQLKKDQHAAGYREPDHQ
jgi:riboflavin kinase / FMN adenylyltransferase